MKYIIILSILMLTATAHAKDLRLVMFRVFHGDLMYIDLPNGKNMIVDTGKKGKPEKFLFPFLEKEGITAIDYMVLSHTDSDHTGGAVEILNKYPVKEIWHNGHERNNKPVLAYKALAKLKNIPLRVLGTNPDNPLPAAFQIDPELHIQVFHPFIKPGRREPKSLNNNLSLVFKLTYKKFTMLFSGDLQKKGQKEVYRKFGDKLKSRVYKVHHHGDRSYTPYIDAVAPEVSICPCLCVPIFFPNRKTVNLLKSYGDFHNVRRKGNIMLTTDGESIKIERFK